MNQNHTHQLKKIRALLFFFIMMLLLSGFTAIPIDPELSLVAAIFPESTSMHQWLFKVLTAYRAVNALYPFLLYGYDWLAFAHFVLAILFIGPYRNPVKNIWVIQFGLIACVLIIPMALIAGAARHIPMGWRFIDCAFGVFGVVPLYIVHQKTRQLPPDTLLTNK